MMKLKYLFIILVGLFTVLTGWAASDFYQFQNKQQEQQFHHLISELRCLVCQNENIADSNAALAKDLRQVVYKMTLAGQNEEQIKTFLVARYSDFVLFKPPLKASTLLLWLSPFVVLMLSIVFIIRRSLLAKKMGNTI